MRETRQSIADFSMLTPTSEEWRYAREVFDGHAAICERPINQITNYLWIHQSKNANRRYRIHSCSTGMGQTSAAAFVTTTLTTWKPRYIVLFGIAGTLNQKALSLGDVFIPYITIGYELTKIVDDKALFDQFSEIFRPLATQTSALLWDRINALRNSRPDLRAWQDECALVRSKDPVLRKYCKNTRPRLVVQEQGALASGNTVIASEAFSKCLKSNVDSRLIAVDMESRGLFAALHLRGNVSDALMIRGISDHADRGKGQLEDETKDRVRRYATQNCVRLIQHLMQREQIDALPAPVSIDPRPAKGSSLIAMKLQVFNSKIGAQHVFFPHAIRILRDAIKMSVSVDIELGDVCGAVSLCVFYQRDGKYFDYDVPIIRENGRFSFALEAFSFDRPLGVGIVSGEQQIKKVTFSVTDVWGSTASAMWTSANGQEEISDGG